MQHAPPISFFLIVSSEQYLVMAIVHKAPRYVVISSLLDPPIFLSTAFSHTLGLFHIHIKTNNYNSVYVKLYSMIQKKRRRDSWSNWSRHSLTMIWFSFLHAGGSRLLQPYSKTSQLCQFFKVFITCLYVATPSCILISKRDHTSIFSFLSIYF